MGRPKKNKTNTEPKDDLDSRLSKLEREFGLQRGSTIKKCEYISTSLYALDYVLDKGVKITKGCHKIELFGRESSGKTTMSLVTVAEFQRQQKICLWIISERFDKEWATKMGVDVNKLLLYYPKHQEDACDKILNILPYVDLIVVDSVASLIPEDELKKTMSEKTRGSQPKVYSEFTRKLYNKIPKEQTVMLFINQLREKQGIMFGNPETTPGGRALRHMYDTRIEFRSGKFITKGVNDKKENIGKIITLTGKKNKLGAERKTAVINFYFDGEIDNYTSLLFAGIKYGVITLEGRTYSYNDKKVSGKDNFIQSLDDKDWKEIAKKLWEIDK